MESTFETAWLIDDNEIDNFINKKIMLKNNFALNVTAFNSASAAEEHLVKLLDKELLKSEIPEIIFLDLNMPMINGIDFLKKCEKNLLMINPRLKVVILTSSVNPNDEFSTSVFSSFLAYINKPLNADNLSKLTTQ